MSKMDINPQEASNAHVELLNRVWTDDAFSARLKSDPKAVLAEMGAELPDDLEISVVSDSEKVKYVHIPAPPPEGEVSDEDLVGVQGGIPTPVTPFASFFGTLSLTGTLIVTVTVHI